MMWGASQKLIKQFDQLTQPYGGKNCSDIARVDWTNKDDVKQYYSGSDSTREDCIRLVGDFAFTLGTILDKELARLNKS